MKYLPYVLLTVALASAVTVLSYRQLCDAIGAAEDELGKPLPVELRARMIARERLARDVIEQRRSFLEVAALFGELNVLSGGTRTKEVWARLQDPSLRLPGRTPDEQLCQQVETWVREMLRDYPIRPEDVLDRLEAEFSESICIHGAVRLPDPATLETVEDLLARTLKGLTDQERRDLFPGRSGGD